MTTRMVFSLTLFILTCIAGSYCMSLECYLKTEVACSHIPGTKAFPNTPEELQEACQNFVASGNCALEIHEECVKNESFWDSEEDHKDFQNTMEFYEENCNEDSPIYQVISRNIECVAATVKTSPKQCDFASVEEDDREKIIELIDMTPFGCVADVWSENCFKAVFDLECGDEIRDAFSKIAPHAVYFTNIDLCEDVQSKLYYLEEAFKSIFSDGKSINEGLPEIFETIENNKEKFMF